MPHQVASVVSKMQDIVSLYLDFASHEEFPLGGGGAVF